MASFLRNSACYAQESMGSELTDVTQIFSNDRHEQFTLTLKDILNGERNSSNTTSALVVVGHLQDGTSYVWDPAEGPFVDNLPYTSPFASTWPIAAIATAGGLGALSAILLVTVGVLAYHMPTPKPIYTPMN
jgi:hypothetical protein